MVGKALPSISMKVQQIIGYQSKRSLWMEMETSDRCTSNKYVLSFLLFFNISSMFFCAFFSHSSSMDIFVFHDRHPMKKKLKGKKKSTDGHFTLHKERIYMIKSYQINQIFKLSIFNLQKGRGDVYPKSVYGLRKYRNEKSIRMINFNKIIRKILSFLILW